jgi:hypothetical protein
VIKLCIVEKELIGNEIVYEIWNVSHCRMRHNLHGRGVAPKKFV